MKGFIRTFIFTFILSISLSGCEFHNVAPWQTWMFDGPPAGRKYTPLYVKGWKDGCWTGAHATANLWYKFKYSFKQDWRLAQNRVYYKGWKDAFQYCQLYVYQYNQRGFI